jgi:Uma2 family endonuclease
MLTNNVDKTITAKELLELSEDGNCYQLIRGQIEMMSPAGGRHGRLANHIDGKLLIVAH